MKRSGLRQAVAVRHVHFEDLGSLEQVLRAEQYEVRYVQAGEPALERLDPLEPDLLVVLGGPVAAYEEHLYPFLSDEILLVERRLAEGLPTLGICLGAQVMARALGARVYAGRKEIGWSPLALSDQARGGCLRHLADTPVLHWHGDTFDLPHSAVHLASTADCENQAFSWGSAALALQFHAEVEPDLLERWYIGHACELANTPSLRVPQLRAQSTQCGPGLVAPAHRMFGEWVRHIKARSAAAFDSSR